MRWIVGVVMLLIVAIALNLTILIYAIGFGVALWFASRRLTEHWSQSIVARRTCDVSMGQIGEAIEIQLDIKHIGKVAATWLFCEDLVRTGRDGRIKPGFTTTGKRTDVFSMQPGESATWKYEFIPTRRGYFQIGPFVLETGDFWGIHRRFKVLCSPVYITVHPKTSPVTGYHIESRRPIGEVVMTHRLFEDPTRISGIREYQHGDAMTRVHWRATARTGKLHSKVFEPSSLAGATIVLDFHEDAYESRDEPVRSELAITAAASIANALYLLNQQFGLLSNGRDAVDRIAEEGFVGDSRIRDTLQNASSMKQQSNRLRPVQLKTSKRSDRMLRMLDTLARLEKTDGLSLHNMLASHASELPRDASVIVIVAQMTLERALGLELLHRQGFAVTAIVNAYDTEHYQNAAAILAKHGIPTRHLRDETSLAEICHRHLVTN